MRVRTISARTRISEQDRRIQQRVNDLLLPFVARNAFNPSVLVVDATVHLAVRAFAEGTRSKPFGAWYGRADVATGAEQLVDLTTHVAAAVRTGAAPPVADPKLFGFDGRVFATFNSGSGPGGPNDVFVMQVWPELGPPQRCVLEPRNRIEKNWAFFADGGRLRALYSLDPVTSLRLDAGTPGTTDELVFVHEDHETPPAARFAEHGRDLAFGIGRRMLSMGTQPIVDGDTLLLVAHEKLYLRRHHVYVGRPLRLTLAADHTITAGRVGPPLIDAFRTSVPRRGTHNPAAVAVTYFSGLSALDDGRVLLSYGVNDLTARVAVIDREKLW